MKNIKQKLYHWCMKNLHHRIMYKHVYTSISPYKIWLPRWGWSKRQISEAKKRADELFKNLNWE